MEFLSPQRNQQAAQSNQTQFLAVGDVTGVLHVMELPRNLRRAVQNEEKILEGFFSREINRVHYIAKLKQNLSTQAAESTASTTTVDPVEANEADDLNTFDEKAEEEYIRMEAVCAYLCHSPTLACEHAKDKRFFVIHLQEFKQKLGVAE